MRIAPLPRIAALMLQLAGLAAGTASAHEFWVEPMGGGFKPGDRVTGELKVGQNLVGEPYPYLSNRFRTFTVDTGADTGPVTGIEGDIPALAFTAEPLRRRPPDGGVPPDA